jgi:pimeloyl-ACP methyl ester carboxylesterase
MLKYQLYSIMVYHVQGNSDKKVFFLHGGALDNAILSWNEVMELMGTQYDCYALDFLGYGKSDKPDMEYSIPMYVEMLYSILQQLDIEKTHLVGLSMGGGIGIAFSLKYPDMVDKLTLVDPLGFYERMPFHTLCRWYVNSKLNSKSYQWMAGSKKIVRWCITSSLFGDSSKVTDELVNTLYNLLQQPECNKSWESFQRYELGKKKMTTDLASHLYELSMPVLIINGEKDTGVPVKYAIAASKAIKLSQLYIMKGCRHWPQKERPEEFVQILKKFLNN